MDKLEELQKELNNRELDALLITSPVNRRYITGFTGTEGIVLIGRNTKKFITDFRYMDQANEQIKDFDIIEHKAGMLKTVQAELKRAKIETLGFEKSDVTYGLFEQFEKELKVGLQPTDGLIESLRLLKNPEEIEILQYAAKIADNAFEHIKSFIKPGVREIEISNELEFFMRKLGATSSSFDIIVASGIRSSLPHGVASNKKIETGELVTMDFGALYNGYCSDITRTVAVGEISNELETIYDTVLTAQKKGVEGIKPGMTGREADALTRNHIVEEGFGGYFGHSTGHGLGMDVHESPALSPKSETVLKSGMVVTVEPGIYVPNLGGCRIEDDILITKDGNIRLTTCSKELFHV